MIYASKNEVVCCEVQTHFGSSLRTRFAEKVRTNFHDFWVPKPRCLFWSSHTFWKFFACNVYRESCGRMFTIYASKNEAVSMKFRRLLEVLRLQALQKKVLGAISWFVYHANKHSWFQHFVKKLWSHCTILHAHKSLLCCSDTLWSSWLSHFIRTHCFESEHMWTMTAPTNCDLQVWLYAKQFQKNLGLARQTCFVVSELGKNEMILWNLTEGKLRGNIKLSRS